MGTRIFLCGYGLHWSYYYLAYLFQYLPWLLQLGRSQSQAHRKMDKVVIQPSNGLVQFLTNWTHKKRVFPTRGKYANGSSDGFNTGLYILLYKLQP